MAMDNDYVVIESAGDIVWLNKLVDYVASQGDESNIELRWDQDEHFRFKTALIVGRAWLMGSKERYDILLSLLNTAGDNGKHRSLRFATKYPLPKYNVLSAVVLANSDKLKILVCIRESSTGPVELDFISCANIPTNDPLWELLYKAFIL